MERRSLRRATASRSPARARLAQSATRAEAPNAQGAVLPVTNKLPPDLFFAFVAGFAGVSAALPDNPPHAAGAFAVRDDPVRAGC
jgi:hypothetical protein